MTHYVYRHFDAAGHLLYVGCTSNPKRREASRLSSGEGAHWVSRVAFTTHEMHESRDAALVAERQAIITERPEFNIKDKPRVDRNMPTATPSEYLTVEQAALELCITPRAVRHRIVAGRIKAEKFGNGGTAPYMIERAEVLRAKDADRGEVSA